jgi:hypothetical protein
MRVLNINFQSVKSKVHELSLLLDSAKPDIIVGCEIWLKAEIHNSEIMPPNYTIYRNDRKDGNLFVFSSPLAMMLRLDYQHFLYL